MNAEKYGTDPDTEKTNLAFYKILSILKSEGYFINNLFDNPHFRISNYKYNFKKISKFSEQFVIYISINNTNIEINLKQDEPNNLNCTNQVQFVLSQINRKNIHL